MNLSAENIGKIRELVRSGYPLKARDAKDLLGHNDHLVELLEARGRLMLGVEIERDQLRAEVAGLKTGYQAYERVNAELKAENEALRKALGNLLLLYVDDEGCQLLPEYIAGRAAMSKGEQP